ncbi:replication-relaxation family protein [Actinokineospora sp. NBRC 105648]|uniref:replication-relaxation family protein n=1 Tax=Actinokineospora sp. NBRC 105648 TaxID=3032206 RepID=UPI0024A57C27|nr:replication-relaxation family protein [Actinokineospora sp. NBRC 105648]GLZ40934.1 hypothetical protein Acsp05_45580 [Actinokineospora sp. NBRC 105648]
MTGGHDVSRVRQAHVDWVVERLTPRDWSILTDLDRLRLLTGSQLERLHFPDLHDRSRSVVRWRVLKRLTDWRVISPLSRRVGGSKRGSAGAAYTLDSVGLRLIQLQDGIGAHQQVRRSALPGERFLGHILAGSELFVRLVEQARTGAGKLADYRAEPRSWQPDGLGGWLKPDAYIRLVGGGVEDNYFVEIDRATEHISTISRKVTVYLDFYRRGQLGPHGIMPRVLFVAPDGSRRDALKRMIESNPGHLDLFIVETEATAARSLFMELTS